MISASGVSYPLPLSFISCDCTISTASTSSLEKLHRGVHMVPSLCPWHELKTSPWIIELFTAKNVEVYQPLSHMSLIFITNGSEMEVKSMMYGGPSFLLAVTNGSIFGSSKYFNIHKQSGGRVAMEKLWHPMNKWLYI